VADVRDQILEQIPHLRRYARALLGYRDGADDLVQDCLARAWSRLHLWQPGSNMRTWLFTILHNLHVNTVRRENRAPFTVPVDDVAESRMGVPANQGNGLAVRDLNNALRQLPDEQLRVILLVGLEEMTYAETAEVVGVPAGTVMSRLSRGRERLRRIMENGGAPDIRRVK